MKPARTTHPALPLALLIALQGCANAPLDRQAAASSAATQARDVKRIGPADRPVRVKAVPTPPPQAYAELDSALGLVKAEQYEPAIAAFKKLAATLPDNAIPSINLALIYKQLDKLDLAETHLKEALAIEPDSPVAGNELGMLYRKTGRFAEARAVYETTLVKYPHFAMAHKNLGVLCDLYLREYQCAIDHYETYATSAPNDKSVEIWIADLRKRLGTKEQR